MFRHVGIICTCEHKLPEAQSGSQDDKQFHDLSIYFVHVTILATVDPNRRKSKKPGPATLIFDQSRQLQSQRSQHSYQNRITAGDISAAPGSRTAAAHAVRTQCRGWESLAGLPTLLPRSAALVYLILCYLFCLYLQYVETATSWLRPDPNTSALRSTGSFRGARRMYTASTTRRSKRGRERLRSAKRRRSAAPKGDKPRQYEALLGTDGRPPSLTAAAACNRYIKRTRLDCSCYFFA